MKTRNQKILNDSAFESKQNKQRSFEQIQQIMKQFSKMSVPEEAYKLKRYHTSMKSVEYFKMMLKKCQSEIYQLYKIDKNSNVGESIQYQLNELVNFLNSVKQQRQSSLKFIQKTDKTCQNTNDQSQRIKSKILSQEIRNKQEEFEHKKNFNQYDSKQCNQIKAILKQNFTQKPKIMDRATFQQNFEKTYERTIEKCDSYLIQQEKEYKSQLQRLFKQAVSANHITIIQQRSKRMSEAKRQQQVRAKYCERYNSVMPLCLNPHSLYQFF